MLTTFAVLVGLLAPSTAKIVVKSTPSVSTVEVDGKKTQLRFGAINVKAGKHKITVRRSGYASQSKTVSARAGKTTTVTFKLVRAKAVKKPATKKPVIVGRRPIRSPVKTPSKRPATKKPVAKKPVAKKPVRKKPIKKKPRYGKKTTPVVGKKKNPRIKRKPKVATGRRPKTTRRPRTSRPRGTTGVAGGYNQPPPPRRRRTSYKPWAVFSFVVGGLAVTGGVLAGMQADDKAKEFNDSVDRRDKQTFKDEAEGWALGSNVLYGVGATGVVVGALLWAMDPGDGYAAQIVPLPDGGAMVGVGGTF